MQSKIICVSGGSGSGKTTVAREIQNRLGADKCVIIYQDNYYRDQSELFDKDGGSVNFDHPSSLEFSLMATHLKDLRLGKSIEMPSYDFASHKRSSSTTTIQAAEFIIVDGMMVLAQAELREFFDLSIFLDIDEDTRFARRLKRDTQERGRTPEGVREQFYNQVKPMHDKYVEPAKQYASLVCKTDPEIEQAIVAALTV